MPNGGRFEGSLSTSNISHSGCPVPGDGDDGAGPQNDITFAGGSQNNRFDYYFRATDAVTPTNNTEGSDTVTNDTADGVSVGGADTYRFSRDVAGMALNLGGYISVNLNRSDRTITFDGASDGTGHGYYLEVTGDLYQTDSSDAHTVEVDPNGDSVNGMVGSGSNTWEYTGELARIGLDAGTATVDVTRRHTLTIEDYQDDTTSTYDFTVSGSLSKGDKADGNDTVSGDSASGQVNNGIDSFVYTGRITDFTHSGAVHTFIDGTEVITPSIGHNTVGIEGLGSRRNYTFAVIGGLGKSAAGDLTINRNDTITDRTAEGSVSNGDDSYDYRDAAQVAGRDWNGLSHYFFTR